METWRRENPGRCLPCGGVGGDYTPGEGFSGTCEACGGTGWETDIVADQPLEPASDSHPNDPESAPCP